MATPPTSTVNGLYFEKHKHASDSVEALEDVPPESVNDSEQLIGEIRELTDPNYLYYKCLSLLQLGGLEAEIPRLVVFGQQSMGKTTLLDFIMGGPIGYSSTDTGTRQPVVIMLNPAEGNRIECIFKNERMSIKQLQDAMAEHMKSTSEQLSDTELKVEIFVPGGVYAVFVDLPGIKDDSKVGSEFTRSVVRNYVRHNPNDLYVLVKKSSDDPANWPWSLKEFILSSAPRGLGLTRRQTVVVGTRAKEFVLGEKNDVRTQQELLNRVAKRAVTDVTGEPFPLYLLELYSLDVELKTSGDFQVQKAVMYEQIYEGQAAVLDLLVNGFEATTSMKARQKLLNYFDVELFKKELNVKFQGLLNEQLGILERRLARKRADTKNLLVELEGKETEFSPSACREHVKLFVRELIQIVTELLTGNYVVMRLPENGKRFLSDFGGSLIDNLTAGNQLALELFPNPAHYDVKVFEDLIKQLEKEGEVKHSGPLQGNMWQSGQIVRFRLPKNDSKMFGIIDEVPSFDVEDSISSDAESAKNISVTFFVRAPGGQSDEDLGQKKIVNTDRLVLIEPLPLSHFTSGMDIHTIECWRKVVRSDGWIGLNACEIAIEDIVELNNDDSKEVSIKPLDPTSASSMEIDFFSAKVKDIYIDVSSIPNIEASSDVADSYIRGRSVVKYAHLKLLNQLAITSLASWMQQKISFMEPKQRFSDQIMLQMMRSVHHVIDKADWQPLIADLLQANIRDGMLNLTKLVSCSAGVALRRTIKAACVEMRRLVQNGGMRSGLMYLIENQRFSSELDDAVEEYCRTKALRCVSTMENAIFEQTYAIRFEIIEDLFEGCSRYEEEFLKSQNVRQVMKSMREYLRKREHAINTIERMLNVEDEESCNLIYTEVRMQFWVAKMLLSAPLATNIYTHFIRSVIDTSSHLASTKNSNIMCEGELESFLHMTLLGNSNQSKDRTIIKQDEELMEHYEFAQELELYKRKRAGMERVDAYVKIAQEAINKLRTQIHRKGGVDFLMRLDVAGQEYDKYDINEEKPDSPASSYSAASAPSGLNGNSNAASVVL